MHPCIRVYVYIFMATNQHVRIHIKIQFIFNDNYELKSAMKALGKLYLLNDMMAMRK